MTARAGERRSSAYELLRWAAVAFIVAVAVHDADHAYRGPDVISPQVRLAGIIQVLVGIVAVVLVFRRHRWAPLFAVSVGFASALLFSAAHLLPTWGALSDSFLTPTPEAGVTVFSWATAVLEISADVAFGWAGLLCLRSQARHPGIARSMKERGV